MEPGNLWRCSGSGARAHNRNRVSGGAMRLVLRFMGLEILALESSSDDEPDEYQQADIDSEIIYAEPDHPIGFTLPSTEWGDDDDDDSAE